MVNSCFFRTAVAQIQKFRRATWLWPRSLKNLHASGHSIDCLGCGGALCDGERKVTQWRLVVTHHHLVEMHQGRILPTICFRCLNICQLCMLRGRYVLKHQCQRYHLVIWNFKKVSDFLIMMCVMMIWRWFYCSWPLWWCMSLKGQKSTIWHFSNASMQACVKSQYVASFFPSKIIWYRCLL